MITLQRALAPTALGILISLSGCTGVNPHNWAPYARNCGSGSGQASAISMFASAPSPHTIHAPDEMRQAAIRGQIRQHWNLARAMEERGELDQAAEHYHQILQMDPSYASAHHRLGVLSSMNGEYEQADEYFLQARLANHSTRNEAGNKDQSVEPVQASAAFANPQASRSSASRPQPFRQGAKAIAEKRHQRWAESTIDAYYSQDEPTQKANTQLAQAQSRVATPVKLSTSAVGAQATAENKLAVRSSSPFQQVEELRSAPQQSAAPRTGHGLLATEDRWSANGRTEAEIIEALSSPPESRESLPTRPVSSVLRPTSSTAPLSRSAELHENTLRPKQKVVPTEINFEATVSSIAAMPHEEAESENIAAAELATDSGNVAAQAPLPATIDEPLARPAYAATSGIRRTSNQEPDRAPVGSGAVTRNIEQLSIIRHREHAARSELMEAEVEARVEQELQVSLAERRVQLAREQLRIAQRHLVEAMVAVAAETEAEAATGQPMEQPSQDHAEPARLQRGQTPSRLPSPAQRTSGYQPAANAAADENDFLAEASLATKVNADEGQQPTAPADFSFAEPTSDELAEGLVAEPARLDFEQAEANTPAEASPTRTRVPQTRATKQAEPIVRTSHWEESLEPAIEITDSDELPTSAPALLTDAEPAEVRRRHQLRPASRLPEARANQPEQPLRSLDEQTLHRREIGAQGAFIKRPSGEQPSLLYR